MNSGGGGAYNKAANRRKPSSLVLSRPQPNPGVGGVVLPAGARRNVRTGDGGGCGGGGRRGGQLQLQSVSRAPPSLATKEPSSKPVEHRNGQHRQQWSAEPPPPPRANNALNVSNNSTSGGYSSRGYAHPNRVGVKHQGRVPNRYASGTRQNGVLVEQGGSSEEGRGSQNMAQAYQRTPRSQAQGQLVQEISAPRRQNGQAPQASTAAGSRAVEESRSNGAAHQNCQVLSQQSRGDQHRPAGNSSHAQRHPPSRVTPSAANAYATVTASNATAGTFDSGGSSLQNGSPRTGRKVTPPLVMPPQGRQHTYQAGFHSQSGVSQDTRTGGQDAAPAQGVVDLTGGEAALCARLAELEERNAQMSARVSELEEHNFDLEASMQLIEAEASHRVQKEAKALQSELSFKDHQLKQAQSNHTTAVKELNAERSRRKADREQARREREEAMAAAAAEATAVAEAAAAAETAAAAEAAAVAEAEAAAEVAPTEELCGKASATRRRRSMVYDCDEARVPPLHPTLAELVLEELSEDVMVLLHAGVSAGSGEGVRVGEGVGNGDEGVFWLQIPSGSRICRGGRGVFSPSSSFIAPDPMSLARARARATSSFDGRLGGNLGDSGGAREGSSARLIGQRREFSPLSLAFSPGLQAPRQRGPRAEELSTARGSARSGSGSTHAGGVTFSCSKSSRGNVTDTQSPRQYRRGDGKGAREVGVRLEEELRFLSSQLFSCAIALVQREACAWDLLNVLAGFLETAGEAGSDDLEILSSAVRLVHRTLAVVPPAAVAVALGGVQHAAPPAQDPIPTEGSVAAATASLRESAGLDGDHAGDAYQSPPWSPAPGKGEKRARSELDGDVCGTGNGGSRSRSRPNEVAAEEEGRSVDGDNTGVDGRRDRRPGDDRNDGNCRRPPGAERSCSLFIAGERVRPQDAPPSAPVRASGGAGTVTDASPCAGLAGSGRKDEGVCTAGRMGGRRGEGSWAGKRGERELGRRLNVELVASFHRGAAHGCSALVECCLEAILCALWDRRGEDLTPWGCLLDLGSYREVMLSEVHRSAWEVGARVLGVLARSNALFQRMLTVGRALESNATVGDSGSAVHVRGSGGVGEVDAWDAGACDSLLRRLCLEAVAIGDHASFGQDVGLRLSVIRFVFSLCQRYGVKATWPLFVGDGIRVEDARDGATGSGPSADVGKSTTVEQPRSMGLIPAVVMFVRVEHEEWERRKYSQPNPINSERDTLLKEAFQLLWVLATHTPLPLREMAQGAGMFNTMVSVVSRFYNSVEMEEFQVHKEALMLMEKMN